MAQGRVVVIKEATATGDDGQWVLCFQYCRYEYGNGEEETGYRFIWRRPNGNLQGARGQARIPSIGMALKLMSTALEEGWGHYKGEITATVESE